MTPFSVEVFEVKDIVIEFIFLLVDFWSESFLDPEQPTVNNANNIKVVHRKVLEISDLFTDTFLPEIQHLVRDDSLLCLNAHNI